MCACFVGPKNIITDTRGMHKPCTRGLKYRTELLASIFIFQTSTIAQQYYVHPCYHPKLEKLDHWLPYVVNSHYAIVNCSQIYLNSIKFLPTSSLRSSLPLACDQSQHMGVVMGLLTSRVIKQMGLKWLVFLTMSLYLIDMWFGKDEIANIIMTHF